MSVKTKSTPSPKVSKYKEEEKHELPFANLPNFLPNLEKKLNFLTAVSFPFLK